MQLYQTLVDTFTNTIDAWKSIADKSLFADSHLGGFQFHWFFCPESVIQEFYMVCITCDSLILTLKSYGTVARSKDTSFCQVLWLYFLMQDTFLWCLSEWFVCPRVICVEFATSVIKFYQCGILKVTNWARNQSSGTIYCYTITQQRHFTCMLVKQTITWYLLVLTFSKVVATDVCISTWMSLVQEFQTSCTA